MDIRMTSKDGSLVASVSEVVEQIRSQIQSNQTQWLEQISAEPGRLAEMEPAVHRQFSQLADRLVAALLVEASKRSAAEDAKKKSWLRRVFRCARPKDAP